MTTITIELPDEEAAALRARAIEEGLSLERWVFRELCGRGVTTTPARAKAAAQRILELQQHSKPDPEGMTIKDYINFGRL